MWTKNPANAHISPQGGSFETIQPVSQTVSQANTNLYNQPQAAQPLPHRSMLHVQNLHLQNAPSQGQQSNQNSLYGYTPQTMSSGQNSSGQPSYGNTQIQGQGQTQGQGYIQNNQNSNSQPPINTQTQTGPSLFSQGPAPSQSNASQIFSGQGAPLQGASLQNVHPLPYVQSFMASQSSYPGTPIQNTAQQTLSPSGGYSSVTHGQNNHFHNPASQHQQMQGQLNPNLHQQNVQTQNFQTQNLQSQPQHSQNGPSHVFHGNAAHNHQGHNQAPYPVPMQQNQPPQQHPQQGQVHYPPAQHNTQQTQQHNGPMPQTMSGSAQLQQSGMQHAPQALQKINFDAELQLYVGSKQHKDLLERMKSMRKARLTAQTRLEHKHKISIFTLSLISLFVVAISLYALTYSPVLPSSTKSAITFASIISSIFIIIVGLMESQNNYQVRALQMQRCALDIGDLYQKLQIETSLSRDDLQNYADRYQMALQACPYNHDDIDYLMSRLNSQNKNEMSWDMRLKVYAAYYLDVYGLNCLILSIPPVILFLL